MIDDDLHSLRELVREAIVASHLTTREAQDAMTIAHGSLEGHELAQWLSPPARSRMKVAP